MLCFSLYRKYVSDLQAIQLKNCTTVNGYTVMSQKHDTCVKWSGNSACHHGAWSTLVQLMASQLGWGLLSQFPPFRYFPIFAESSKYHLPNEYHIYIWKVSPQPSCGDTCQIWMWFDYLTCASARLKISLTEKSTNRALVTHTPDLCQAITWTNANLLLIGLLENK